MNSVLIAAVRLCIRVSGCASTPTLSRYDAGHPAAAVTVGLDAVELLDTHRHHLSAPGWER